MNSSNTICESIGDANFEEKVLNNGDRPSLIIFGADWSGTSQMLQNVISGVANDFYHEMDFFYLDIEQDNEYANMMNIREVPSVFIFNNGEVIDHFSGLHSRRKVKARLENVLNL